MPADRETGANVPRKLLSGAIKEIPMTRISAKAGVGSEHLVSGATSAVQQSQAEKEILLLDV